MKLKNILVAVATFGIAAPAVAQDIRATSFEGSFRQYNDSDVDGSVAALGAGIEIGLASAFSIGANLSVVDSDETDASIMTTTVHGMYALSDATALGVFAAVESGESIDASNYGVEFGTGTNGTRLEAYFGVVDSDDLDDRDRSIAGLSFEFQVARGFSVGFDYESISQSDVPVTTSDGSFLEDVTFGDTALFVRYSFENGPSVFAEVGQIASSFSTADTRFISEEEIEYVAIGASYSIGRSTGTIFGNRSFLDFGGLLNLDG
ncbi:MAG: hypothetical protein NWQ23_12335 [Yoonia sp.]|uniref:hypothetical protein n=1 Tax=Yoonia sp. TaxID=2212373 RepID=UPI00273E4279|nr:hypothetical protein [Yoonia sp.]MDP5086201.1 hypothetical protein [Yoonia sp.]